MPLSEATCAMLAGASMFASYSRGDSSFLQDHDPKAKITIASTLVQYFMVYSFALSGQFRHIVQGRHPIANSKQNFVAWASRP